VKTILRPLLATLAGLLRSRAVLQLGFMKMSGCALYAFEMVPPALLAYLGRELEMEVPTVTSVRALYTRRSTLF